MLGQKRIPSREGGIEVVVEELCTRMVQQDHQVTCFNRGGHNVAGKEYDLKKVKEYHGIVLKDVFTIDRRGLAAVSSSVSATIMAALGCYDVVHIHAEGPAFMCWLPKLFGKRIIVTVHGLDHQRAKWGKLASQYIMLGEKNAVKYADEIIVLSKNVQKYFMDTYQRKTQFIPNGISHKEKRKANLIKKKYDLDKDDYILYLGRIVPEKGIQYLINAFKQIKTNKKLVIAGGASDSDAFFSNLKNLAKEDERILFTGFVKGRLKHELYSNAYIYVLPSDLEGMPLSLLEAMAYGNCCLVSNIDECKEVVEDKAVVFEKSNTEDLKEKLEWLISHVEEVEKYKAEAAEFICSKYNWDDVVEKTVRVYR